ncbi:MAG: ABC transporter ATP-binding protein [Bacillota bacterium]
MKKLIGVEIKNLSKNYRIGSKNITALDNIELSIEKNSFTTVVGRSGCGKTTLLRLISGLETSDKGKIELNFYDKESGNLEYRFISSSSSSNTEMLNRRVSMVFQEPRLMPWLNVEENIAFSIQNKKSGNDRKNSVDKYLKMLGLEKFRRAYPAQISGGMAQRVALVRTLAYEADLILMDEPLGALDAFNRRQLQKELIEIYEEFNKTIVFVTHDVEEAVYLGQKVVIMDKGKIMDEIEVDVPYSRKESSKKLFSLKEDILNRLTA